MIGWSQRNVLSCRQVNALDAMQIHLVYQYTLSQCVHQCARCNAIRAALLHSNEDQTILRPTSKVWSKASLPGYDQKARPPGGGDKR
eukprot:3657569-Rhodomonas_salina.3